MNTTLIAGIGVAVVIVLLWVVFLNSETITGNIAKTTSKNYKDGSNNEINGTWHKITSFSVQSGEILSIDLDNPV